MRAITIVDLGNAKLDADHIADIATSPESTAVDRFGNIKQTLSGAVGSIASVNNRGAWMPATSYAIKDIVSVAGTWYIAITVHVSSAAFLTDSAAKWRVYQGINAADLAAPGGAELSGCIQIGGDAVLRAVQAKLRDTLVEADYSTLASAIAAVGAKPRRIVLGGRTSRQLSVPTNTYGVRFGDGKVLVPSLIPGFSTQLNTYADDVNGLMIGRENLAAFLQACSAGTRQQNFIFGDSTVANGDAYPLRSHQLVQRACYQAGVNDALFVNRGVSGTAWGDLNALPDLSVSTKLIIIKYGINDATKVNALSTFATDARRKISEIRAAQHGQITSLSILLMGPNSTYRPSLGQDAQWYEDLRNIYLQLCKEFDCAYFDTYAYLQNTRRAPGFWLDDVGGGEGIHPDPVAAFWIWCEGFCTHVLGGGQWNIKKSNQNWNISNYTRPSYPSTGPQSYPYGQTVESALFANLWPFNGVLVTVRHADGSAVQTLSTLDVVPRTATRRGGGETWTQWTGVPVAVGALLNGWINKPGGYQAAGYQVGADGFIDCYGVISSGVSGVAAFNLPGPVRPASARVFQGNKVTIFSDGNVIPSTSDVTLVSLDGIRFKATSA